MELLVSLLLLGSGFFFLAGTAGLLRFPDLYCRLHAVTKADNLALGLLVLALLPGADNLWVALKLLLVWAVAVLVSATNSHLLARAAARKGVAPWTSP